MPRQFPRVKTKTLFVTLRTAGRSSDGRVLDISRSGAFIENCNVGGADTEAEVSIESDQSRIQVNRHCTIKRAGAWSAIQFSETLTNSEMGQLVPEYGSIPRDNKDLLEFANKDAEAIHWEIEYIKQCRSSIFLATIGSTGAAVIAISGLALKLELSPGEVLLGILISGALFLIGVLSSIEKARALNSRYGYLRVLNDSIFVGNLPIGYAGWARQGGTLLDCGQYCRLGACPRNETPKSPRRCKNIGEQQAEPWAKTRRLYVDMYSSFMSLSSFVYSSIYLLLLIAYFYYMKNMLQWAFPTVHAPMGWLLVLYIVGIAASPFVFRWARAVTLIILGGAVGVYFGGLVSVTVQTYGSSIGSGILIGLLGCVLLRQLNEVRRGNHTAEVYYHAWKMVIDSNCPAALKTPIENPPDTPANQLAHTAIDFFLRKKKPTEVSRDRREDNPRSERKDGRLSLNILPHSYEDKGKA